MTENAPRAQAWVILVISVVAQMAATVAITGPAFLIPHMNSELGYSLTQAGTIAVAPSYGLILTLIAWGAFADRFGERLAIILGISLTALATGLALVVVGSPIWMIVLIAASGAAAASVNSASGRMIMGWFPRHRRGLAMGIRQMAPPLGTSVAALAVPPIAAEHGVPGYLWFIVAVNGVMALVCVIGVRNPPHALAAPSPDARRESSADTEAVAPAEAVAPDAETLSPDAGAEAAASALGSAGNPYRRDSFLWRIHAASALLVIPQFAFATYGLIWLISNQHVDAAVAGAVVAASQIVGALGRMIIGGISDKARSRVGLMRVVAVLAVILVGHVALVSLTPVPILASIVFILAATVSVADNGLAFASVAEAAGPRWAGKALGAQNTGQFVMSAALGPGLGALITLWGYPLAFAAVALAPLLSLGIIPKRDIDRIT